MTEVALSMGLFVVTLAVYEGLRFAQLRTRRVWQNPLLLGVPVLGVLLVAAKIEPSAYREATRPLGLLVGPSVVALGLGLSEGLPDLAKRARTVVLSLVAGAVVGAGSVVGVARALGGDAMVCASLAPKSATTAIAAPVAERLGGDPSLTAVVVIVVGVFGALAGPPLLRRIGVRNRYVFGLSLGAAAHIVGTTRARDEGPVEESASAAALVVHGVLTALCAWAAVRLLAP
jgi:putative effector of murein hydrolase